MAKEYFVKEEDIDVLKDNVDNKISSPNTAEVGQILSVKAIDGNGKPTEWEAVNKPGSGPGESSPYIYMTQAEYEALTEYEQDKMYWVTYPLTGLHFIWRNGEAIEGIGRIEPDYSSANIYEKLNSERVVLNFNPRSAKEISSLSNNKFKYIEMTNKVTKLENYAFNPGFNSQTAINALVSVYINDVISNIPQYAFKECGRLENVKIGNSVTEIQGSSFQSCYSLKSITIPDSVESIGAQAFYLCNKLETVVIGNGITTIATNAFGTSTSSYDEKLELIVINKPSGSISGAPWGARKATVVWNG